VPTPPSPVRRGWPRGVALAAACSILAVAALLQNGLAVPGVQRVSASVSGLHVSGNQLVAGSGQAVHLAGVNRSGTEYACIQGWGIFDGPSNAASIQAMASWHVNTVRIPLNEDCWLGINGAPAAFSGASYQQALVGYVSLLHQYGMYAELSLIWAAPGGYQATYQPGAPDEDHAPALWSSLAATFKSDPGVVLAPWGETIVDWSCFLNGGVCEATYGSNNTPYNTAGMQQAVTLMRQAGYTGPIAIPGIDYANDLSQWLQHEPSDPLHQIVAEAHIYGKNTCDTISCFNSTLAPVAQEVPLLFGETGETYDASDCGSSYISTFMNWADAHGVGYEAWTWDTWGNCEALISDYNGTAYSAYGAWVRAHYASLPPPATSPPPTSGYWLVGADGGIFPFGNAPGYGSTGGLTLNAPVVGMAATPSGHGYWLVGADGGIFPFGDAQGYGSTGGIRLNKPIVGMAATPSGHGYWLVAGDGGIFPFGDAQGYGSTGNIRLNQPIVGMTANRLGGGYWLLAADGGVFPFGPTARGYGSTGNIRLNQPIVGMASTHDGGGYWLVAADGGIFPFGDAAGYGSTGGTRLTKPVVGMSATTDGAGYWLVAADGGIFPFGDAAGYGSTGGIPLNRPMVGMATLA
jgi:hypothetical protein